MAKSAQVNHIGVLTGGGDCPGLNAVIRAVVKTATDGYGMKVTGVEDGFEGLIYPKDRIRELTSWDVRGILPRGGTILGTTNRGNPFEYAGPKGGKSDMSQTVLRNIAQLGIEALIVIGGDGSLKIANQFSELGVKVVGIPKTIDNDLSATDVTFGFDTALNTAMEALDRLHTTAESHHRVMVLELMGRDAGWIALEAGIAGGADVILIPEIPFDLGSVCRKVQGRNRAGRAFSIVVVAEGAMEKGGKQIYAEPGRLGGMGEHVARRIHEETKLDTRVTVLGHLQRGGSPSAFDRILGTRYGAAAAHLVAEGGFGRMVCLHTPKITSVPLAEAVNVMKRVPLDGDVMRSARSVGISFGD